MAAMGPESGPVPTSSAHRPHWAAEWLRTLAAVTGMLVLYFVAPLGQDDDPLPLTVAMTLSVLLAIGLAVLLSRRIIRVLEGDSTDGLPGLMTVLALVVVTFATVYFMLARSDPGQVAGLETRLDSLYFTLTTLVTVGYGDIHPAGQAARGIACMQFVFNAIFVAGLVRAIFYEAQAKRVAGRR
jgi:voltage-gated potassium channel